MTKVLSKKSPLTCVRAFQQIAHACLGDIERGHRSARRGDAEGIHRMRIGFTKLAAARKFFSAMVTDSEWSLIKSEIAWLDGLLGGRTTWLSPAPGTRK
jgi:CHAD domain-containing protein